MAQQVTLPRFASDNFSASRYSETLTGAFVRFKFHTPDSFG
jgi:hypothetical protein